MSIVSGSNVESDARPVVAVVEFEDSDPMRGFSNVGREVFQRHFRLVTQRELENDATLLESVGAVAVVGNTGKLLTEEWLDRMKNMKVVATVSAGYNHLPLERIKQRNIR